MNRVGVCATDTNSGGSWLLRGHAVAGKEQRRKSIA